MLRPDKLTGALVAVSAFIGIAGQAHAGMPSFVQQAARQRALAVSIEVASLDCANCQPAKALQRAHIPGVQWVQVDREHRTIRFLPLEVVRVDANAAADAVRAAGYQVVSVRSPS